MIEDLTVNNIQFPYSNFNLVPQYYSSKLQQYLNEQMERLGVIFDESIEKKNFQQMEIEQTKMNIANEKNQNIAMSLPLGGHAENLRKLKGYLEWLNKKNETPNPETLANTGSQKKKSELTNKAKVLVLKKLGFFELPKIIALPDTKKGVLLNGICGGSETNFTDYVGNLFNTDPKDPKNPNTKDAVNQLHKLLKEINLQSE